MTTSSTALGSAARSHEPRALALSTSARRLAPRRTQVIMWAWVACLCSVVSKKVPPVESLFLCEHHSIYVLVNVHLIYGVLCVSFDSLVCQTTRILITAVSRTARTTASDGARLTPRRRESVVRPSRFVRLRNYYA